MAKTKDQLKAIAAAVGAIEQQFGKRAIMPRGGAQGLEIAATLVRPGAVDLVVVDSVAALTPRAEIDGDMGDAHMGLQARLMSQAMRKLTAVISRTSTSVVFINQLRQKIGIVYG